VINLRVDTEQRPDPESRIITTGAVDALGLPRVAIDWRVSALERHTVLRTATLLAAELERRGVGSMAEWQDPFASDVPWGELKGDSFHMMGGARMAEAEEQGVVDVNARLFGVDNVYLAGASIFPTGGMANPTLTLIALALRLADHLSSRG
jgi:choline dehydrogenase-like flavoprotein